MTDEKATLHGYLQSGRDALLWKLEDVAEYDKRRPLVPSGTNLLGLVKHVAGVEAGETHRHAGHADIVRELIDGAVGMRRQVTNVPPGDRSWWASHVEQVEAAARAASASTT